MGHLCNIMYFVRNLIKWLYYRIVTSVSFNPDPDHITILWKNSTDKDKNISNNSDAKCTTYFYQISIYFIKCIYIKLIHKIENLNRDM